MVLHFLRDRSLLLLSEEEYITVLAPATGVLLAISVEISLKAICKYRQRQKRFNNRIFKFNTQTKTPVYNPIRLIVLKTSYVQGKIILICSKLNKIIWLTLYKLPINWELWTKSFWVTTDVVIIWRAFQILVDVSKYLRNNKTNVLKTAVNTLIWIVNDEARTLIYKLVFIGVSLATAISWTYVPLLRRILRIWATITMLNLCSNIVVTDGHELWLKYGPKVPAFGLTPIERLERPITELKANAEQLKSLSITLPGNETELIFSSSTQNEMRSTFSKKARIRLEENTSIVMHEKTWIGANEDVPIVPNEETTIVTNEDVPIVANEEITIVTNEDVPIVTNKEETLVPKEELRETNSTSKIKRTIQKSRTNNLQKLNEKFNSPNDDKTSLKNDDNLQDVTNSTKVKEGKVK